MNRFDFITLQKASAILSNEGLSGKYFSEDFEVFFEAATWIDKSILKIKIDKIGGCK